MSNHPLAHYMSNVPDFPKPGILFRDISPLLKHYFQATLAYKHDKGFIKVRKPGKLPNVHASIEYGLEYGRDKLEMQKGDGSRIILLDDLIATGGSMQATCDLCDKVGYNVVGLACLVDLAALNSFSYKGMKVRSVIQYQD